MQQEYPALAIDYRFASNGAVENAIATGAVDIGFMTRMSMQEEVSCEAISQEALLLVTPASVDTPDWLELNRLGFIDHPDGAHHAGLLLAANYPEFQHSDHFAKRGFSNQISLILEPVSLGLGFTVLPAHAVEAFVKSSLIRVHALPYPVCETLYLGLRRHHTQPNRVASVVAKVKALL